MTRTSRRPIFLAVFAAVVLPLAGCQTNAPSLAAGLAPAGSAMTLTVAPVGQSAFAFGSLTDTQFTVRNNSDRAIILRRIVPLNNRAEEPIVLARPVEGQIERVANRDAYTLLHVPHQSTAQWVYAGLLLPGQSVTVQRRYRPLFEVEAFQLDYASPRVRLGPGQPAPLPLSVYMIGTATANETEFVPINVAAWKRAADAEPVIAPPRLAFPARSVLAPGLFESGQTQTVGVAISFEGRPFPASAALSQAALLAGRPAEGLGFAYSQLLDGYVIYQDDSCWLLSSSDRQHRGERLPVVPPAFYADADSGEGIHVRLIPERPAWTSPPPDFRVWGKYLAQLGGPDFGRGVFTVLTREQVPGFLRDLLAHGAGLSLAEYAFRPRYYVLAMSVEGKPITAQ